ncbi:MAG: hypothetical protein WCG01_01035 [bacterium]
MNTEGIVTIDGRRFQFLSNVRLKPVAAELKPLEEIILSKRTRFQFLADAVMLVVCVPFGINSITKNTTVGVLLDHDEKLHGVPVEYLNYSSETSALKCTTMHLITELNKRLIADREDRQAA